MVEFKEIRKGKAMGRVMIAGTSDGCGKTTVACAVMQILKNKGIDVNSFKCGPDCLDPAFNDSIIGIKSYNIDSYMMDKNTIRYLINEHRAEITVIDGIKGYYDGINFTGKAGTHEISVITKTPAVLVMDCTGMTTSAGAVIKGFMKFKNNMIKGVIFNRLDAKTYPKLQRLCAAMKIRCYGYIPKMRSVVMENKHLTLVTDAEIDSMRAKMQSFAEQVEKTLDIDGIIELAKSARELRYRPMNIPYVGKARVAVSYDKAFCLYYRDNIDILKKMGAEIVPFSPMQDEKLPDNINGLILCGGYPEVYASELAKNESMLRSIKSAVDSGLPTIAECAGFMYLHKSMYDITGVPYDMAGVIQGSCYNSDVPVKNGYIEPVSNTNNLLLRRGGRFRTYEYHIYESTDPGSTFTVNKGTDSWKSINSSPTLYAGFPHLHFYTNTKMAERFMQSCVK